MGKKNKGSYMDYYLGTGKVGKMMDRYGVEGVKMGRPSAGGEQRSQKDVEKDIAAAMMNDYDTRRTLEAAALAGNKDAKKYAKKGIKSGKVEDAYRTMEKLKKEYVGGGGMRGAKNEAGLTWAAVKDDRSKLTDSLLEKALNQNKGNDGKDGDDGDDGARSISDVIENGPGVSEGVQGALARIQKRMTDGTDGTESERIYTRDTDKPDDGYDQRRNFDYLASYKKNLKENYDSGIYK